MTKTTLTDGSPVTPDHREIDPKTGMQKGYVVLSDEERAKGFLAPRLDAALQTGKAREILRRNVILTPSALGNLLLSGGSAAILSLSGCGQGSCDDIMAAAAALKVYPLPEPEPGPEIPSFLQQLEGKPEPRLTGLDVGLDMGSHAGDAMAYGLFIGRSVRPGPSANLLYVRDLLTRTPIPGMMIGANGTLVDISGRVICTFNLKDLGMDEAYAMANLLMVAAEAVLRSADG